MSPMRGAADGPDGVWVGRNTAWGCSNVGWCGPMRKAQREMARCDEPEDKEFARCKGRGQMRDETKMDCISIYGGDVGARGLGRTQHCQRTNT